MSLPRYESYKDSGVEWLGEVPQHWDIYEGKRIFGNRRELALSDDDQLAASQKYGVIPQTLMMELNASKVMLALKGTESFRHVEKNDFVISLRSFEGGIEHSKYVGCVSPAYTVLRSSKKVVPVFFRYLFKSGAFISAIQTTTDSLRDGKSITYQQFGSISLPIPTSHEQSIIANFLDQETANIDNLIAEQQQLIKLLKEKRQAVISHAVTKGLNPDVPMKDSGVEWLGEVPKHWDIKRLKYIKSNQANAFVDGPFGSNLKSEHFIENGDAYVIESNFATQGKLNLDKLKTISSSHFLTIRRSEVKETDLVIAKIGAQFGKVSILPYIDKPAVVSGNSMKLTVSADICEIKWAYLQLQKLKEIGEMELLVNGSAQPALSLSGMNQLTFLLPPKSEQTIIIDTVETKTQKFETLIAESTSVISLLKERRSALISSAVTGKIDVRNFVPSQPNVEAMA